MITDTLLELLDIYISEHGHDPKHIYLSVDTYYFLRAALKGIKMFSFSSEGAETVMGIPFSVVGNDWFESDWLEDDCLFI